MTPPFNILVVGRSGQVAKACAEMKPPEGSLVTALGRPELDILKADSISAIFEWFQPNLVVNAAAYTAVDQAESDAEDAFALNEQAAGRLAGTAAQWNVPIIHLSTDYVFDGRKTTPYSETDPVAPLGVYGRSKLAGEQAVSQANPAHLILRTAWVYSPFGKNFVRTMLRVASSRSEITVVSDQTGNPTSALDIAKVIMEIARVYKATPDRFVSGVYHMAGSGAVNWADFATHLLTVSERLGGPSAIIKPIISADYPTPVDRPKNSQLSCEKLLNTFGISLPSWQDSSTLCVERIIAQKDWVS